MAYSKGGVSAVDAILAEAADLVALEQIARLNTAHLDDSAALPSSHESRFRRRARPAASPSLPRRRPLRPGAPGRPTPETTTSSASAQASGATARRLTEILLSFPLVWTDNMGGRLAGRPRRAQASRAQPGRALAAPSRPRTHPCSQPTGRPRHAPARRHLVKKLLSESQSEGQGATVRRSIGRHELRNLDPFPLLDEFSVSKPAGFPDHPHRGFETVTYMLEGAFTHQDFSGHKGTIKPGDVQWMTAGRRIVHSEMPASDRVQKGLRRGRPRLHHARQVWTMM